MIYTLTLNPAVDRELTVLDIQFDTVLRATHSQVDSGGKGFNVSRLLQGMGGYSTAVGFLAGKAGEILLAGLQSLGIQTDFVWIEGETRTNVSIVTQTGKRYIKVNESGPAVDLEKQQELLAKIERLAHPGDCWVLAGSLPPGVPESYYAQILKVLNTRKVMALLDTSAEPLRLGCLEKPFLVKPNAEEASALTGLAIQTPQDAAVSAAAIRKLGPQNVVISLGKSGALLQTPDQTWFVHSPSVAEKNPIGAGDSMVGGLVWALSRGHSLKEALGWGVASGAATASLPGTRVGNAALISQLLAQVEFENLEPTSNP